MENKIKVKGIVEAISAKPGREGLKVDGEWFDATERTRQYVAKRKIGDAVYMEVEQGNKIAFCGDLRADDPDKVPKDAPNNAATAKISLFRAHSQPNPPNPPQTQIKPFLALQERDRLIIAQVCLKGAIDMAIAQKQIDSSEVDALARRLEADFYKRLAL